MRKHHFGNVDHFVLKTSLLTSSKSFCSRPMRAVISHFQISVDQNFKTFLPPICYLLGHTSDTCFPPLLDTRLACYCLSRGPIIVRRFLFITFCLRYPMTGTSYIIQLPRCSFSKDKAKDVLSPSQLAGRVTQDGRLEQAGKERSQLLDKELGCVLDKGFQCTPVELCWGRQCISANKKKLVVATGDQSAVDSLMRVKVYMKAWSSSSKLFSSQITPVKTPAPRLPSRPTEFLLIWNSFCLMITWGKGRARIKKKVTWHDPSMEFVPL